MHNRWTHSASGRKKMLAAARGNAAVGRAAHARKAKSVKRKWKASATPKQQRKYVRKGVTTIMTKSPGGDVIACPKCGCNIQAVRIAMNATPEQLGM